MFVIILSCLSKYLAAGAGLKTDKTTIGVVIFLKEGK